MPSSIGPCSCYCTVPLILEISAGRHCMVQPFYFAMHGASNGLPADPSMQSNRCVPPEEESLNMIVLLLEG